MTAAADITVIGGGLVGAAIAFGLAQQPGMRVAVLDEGDIARRASRANFALVWVSSKGVGMPEYATWSMDSADGWAGLAASVREISGIDVAYERPGGFLMCLSDAEMDARIRTMKVMQAQTGAPQYAYEILDHAGVRKRLPAIGPDVVGAIYCDLDGHVNSLRLFRALHVAMARLGVSYRPEHPVDTIVPGQDGFRIRGPWGEFTTGRVVLAAGLDNARLAAMVGLSAPVVPSKGQIIITEKAAPFLNYPVQTVRQTDEGGVMVGDSQEDLGFDTQVTYPVISVMAQRAVRMFPLLAGLNVVRTWSASRVMSPDGFPIYEQSREWPGAFVATCHSGVTLAAAHAQILAPAIRAGRLPDDLACFSARRLNVPKAA
ncbi:FAD-dependent oxidoreductase [Bosea sp. BK604]|uniref:NAD(P)/FAD-dependent oxidoreductase n=1 Tax=Bosea sp. BK604 TaxID=2512180 RepID=UPI00104AC00F|nr:FAD-dependent oxidoreductase [Bosea sp. BK604]TCR65310.1 glycine/D-amino acid oxidase-like deaminating enzyme [Bosea sp. BK604]